MRVTWGPFTETDTLVPVSRPEFCERTIQAIGTFGSANLGLNGSNDGTNFALISNRQGTTMSFTAPGINTTQDRPVWVVPKVVSGTGASITVVMLAHRQDLAGMGR
jgi:hypothetical protein